MTHWDKSKCCFIWIGLLIINNGHQQQNWQFYLSECFFWIKWQNFKRRLLTHIHMEKLEFGLVWEVCSNQCDLCCGLFWEAFPFAQKVVWVDAFFSNKGQLMECLMRSPLIQISGHCKSAKHQTPLCLMRLWESQAGRDLLRTTLQWAWDAQRLKDTTTVLVCTDRNDTRPH